MASIPEALVDVPKVSTDEITGLLQQWRGGSRKAFDQLIPLVYNELRVIASHRLAREWPTTLFTPRRW